MPPGDVGVDRSHRSAVAVSGQDLGEGSAHTERIGGSPRTELLTLCLPDLVEPVSFFTDIRTVILHQHERWDGSGHPGGLIGADIPLLSRILAIADAYDAMTSQRPYREALTKRDALTQLWHERARKYDPQIVETFIMSVELDSLQGK